MKKRWLPPPPAKERANRERLYPAALSWQDKFGYIAIDVLARTQAYILERLIKEPVWRSGTGEVRRICDLHDLHLNNIVRLIHREGLDIDARLKNALLHESAERHRRRFERMDRT